MTFLTIMMLISYLLVAFVTIYGLRAKFLIVIRLLSGLGFLSMLVSNILPVQGIDDYMILLLAISIISSVEITAFKVRHDNRHLYLIHAFTVAMAIALVVYLFVV